MSNNNNQNTNNQTNIRPTHKTIAAAITRTFSSPPFNTSYFLDPTLPDDVLKEFQSIHPLVKDVYVFDIDDALEKLKYLLDDGFITKKQYVEFKLKHV